MFLYENLAVLTLKFASQYMLHLSNVQLHSTPCTMSNIEVRLTYFFMIVFSHSPTI